MRVSYSCDQIYVNLAEHCAKHADVPREDASLQKLDSRPEIQSHERAGVSFFAQLCFCDDGDSLELVLKPTAEELLAAVSESFEVHSFNALGRFSLELYQTFLHTPRLTVSMALKSVVHLTVEQTHRYL